MNHKCNYTIFCLFLSHSILFHRRIAKGNLQMISMQVSVHGQIKVPSGASEATCQNVYINNYIKSIFIRVWWEENRSLLVLLAQVLCAFPRLVFLQLILWNFNLVSAGHLFWCCWTLYISVALICHCVKAINKFSWCFSCVGACFLDWHPFCVKRSCKIESKHSLSTLEK